MLDVMRSNAKSSLIAVLFGAIIFVFIFSFGRGSNGFRTREPETWAAKVNGDLVTASDFTNAYANRFRTVSQQRGGKYTTENAQRDNLKSETLDSLIDQELLAQAAPSVGVAITDSELADEIAKAPQFLQEGKFDNEYYKRLVENGYGMSVPRFEEAYRKDLVRTRVVDAIVGGAAVSDDEVKDAWIAQHEGVAIAYVKFNAFMFRDKAAPTDDEANAYAKDHAKELQDAYEKDLKTKWTQGAAVKVRAFTANLPPNANPDADKAAHARADAAYAEVKGGKEFADVAKEKSDDSLTKVQGGELGFISKGGSAYGPTLETEALKLKVGELSPVFKDRTGFHFLKAEELRDARVQPLDEVKVQIAKDLLKGVKAKELARATASAALASLKEGKEMTDLYPAKKASAPGQFDFASFTTPSTAETEEFHPQGGYVPGIGTVAKLSAAAFTQTAAGGIPDAPVEDSDTYYVFKVKSRSRADLAKFDDAAKAETRKTVEGTRSRALYDAWLERQRKSAKISKNETVLSYETSSQHQALDTDNY
jgi:peptidyl-prolyl cis-trans isomerase D